MSKNIKVKPGKGQSVFGMVIGVIFVLVGLVMAIPALGFFGFIWTGLALVITIMNAINVFSDTGITTHEIVMEERESIQSQKSSVEERLHMVDKLYKEGTITIEEKEEKRKKILDEI